MYLSWGAGGSVNSIQFLYKLALWHGTEGKTFIFLLVVAIDTGEIRQSYTEKKGWQEQRQTRVDYELILGRDLSFILLLNACMSYASTVFDNTD